MYTRRLFGHGGIPNVQESSCFWCVRFHSERERSGYPLCAIGCSEVSSDFLGAFHARRTTCFPSSHQPFTVTHLSSLSAMLPWRTLCEIFPVSRSLSGHSVCAVNLLRKSARYRSMSSCSTDQALSYGDPSHDIAEPTRRYQRTTRLVDLCRLRSGPDQDRPSA